MVTWRVLALRWIEQIACQGSESAIEHHVDSYLYGYYGLNRSKKRAMKLARQYAQKGSLIAMAKIFSEAPRRLLIIEELDEENELVTSDNL